MEKKKYMVILSLTGMLYCSAVQAYEVEAETEADAESVAKRMAGDVNDQADIAWTPCCAAGDVADGFAATTETIERLRRSSSNQGRMQNVVRRDAG